LQEDATLRSQSGATEEGVPFIQFDLELEPGDERDFRVEFLTESRLWTASESYILEVLPATEALVAPTVLDSAELDLQIYEADETSLFAAIGTRYLNFLTEPGVQYYIQYADTLEGPWRTSAVTVEGTGSREVWMDDGPPKTIIHPSEVEDRFYRIVLETPAQTGQWVQDATLGQYFLNDESVWIYHQSMGYLYQEPETHWYYSADSALGWLYLDETNMEAITLNQAHAVNGFAYSSGLDTWVYLSAVEKPDGSIHTLYFDTSLQEWHTIEGIGLGN